MLEFENKPNQVWQAAKRKFVQCSVRIQDIKRWVQSEKYVRKAESIRLKLSALNDSYYINFQFLVTQLLIFRYASLKEKKLS